MVLVIFSLLYFFRELYLRKLWLGTTVHEAKVISSNLPFLLPDKWPIVSQESFYLTTLPSPKLPLLSGVQHVGIYIYIYIFYRRQGGDKVWTQNLVLWYHDKWSIVPKSFNQTLPLGHKLKIKIKMQYLQLEKKKVFEDSI